MNGPMTPSKRMRAPINARLQPIQTERSSVLTGMTALVATLHTQHTAGGEPYRLTLP